MTADKTRTPILAGLRVLDIGHQVAAATCGAILADLGAEVVMVEHPSGGPIRNMLPKKDGQSMWWKVIERGKTQITLNLSSAEGRKLFLDIARDFDVVIENFRPGTLEGWGLGPEDLEQAGLNLTMVRISGFGQTGPLSPQPGYGSVAEAMSGFANMNGFPDGPPTFPSSTLADGVAGLWAVIGVLSSLYGNRDRRAGVEVVDVALVEGLFRIIPTQIATYDQTGQILTRPGNFTGRNGSLRNVYRTSDDRWFIVAGTGGTIRPILVGAGATELVSQLDTGLLKGNDMEVIAAFLLSCDAHLKDWAVTRTYAGVEADMRAAGAVFAPVYNAADIMEDAHFKAREQLVTLADADLGEVTMQGIVPKFPGRNHRIRHPGRAKGWDNDEFYTARGFTSDDLAAMKRDKII